MGRNGPISVIQTLPEAANRSGRSATVGQIRKPTMKPFQSARLGLRPATITQAPTYAAVISTEPTPAATGSWSTVGSGRTIAKRAAGASPSASEGQKRSP